MWTEPYESVVATGAHTWTYTSSREGSVKLGFRVIFAVAGHVVGMRYLRHPSDHGAHVASIHADDGGAPFGWGMQTPPLQLDTPETGSWMNLWMHPRAPVAAGVEYEAGIYFSDGWYAYEPGGLSSALVSGNVTLPANIPDGRRNGIFTYSRLLDSDWGGSSGTLYGIDILFLANRW